MDELRMRAIATATAAVVVAALGAGGAVGAPIAADEMDPSPDSPAYELERVGEVIKEKVIVTDEVQWDLDRAEERTDEFAEMAEKGKAGEHMELVQDAQNNLTRAIERSEFMYRVRNAVEATERHMERLREVENQVPENAREGLRTAVRNASRYENHLRRAIGIAENMGMNELPDVAKNVVENAVEEARRGPPIVNRGPPGR